LCSGREKGGGKKKKVRGEPPTGKGERWFCLKFTKNGRRPYPCSPLDREKKRKFLMGNGNGTQGSLMRRRR